MEDSNPNTPSVKPIRKQTVPAADIDFGAVITSVSAKWLSDNWLTLKWLTAANFATDAVTYNTTLSARLNSGSTRPQMGKALTNLEKQMDEALSYVKGYIVDKYKKDNAVSYYPAFGIEYRGNRYILPTDRNARIASLKLMLQAIQTHQFQDKEYGLAFWTATKTEFEALVNQTTILDGQISVKVGDKNVLKNNLKKGLNSIVGVIKANYPETYKQELRDWGMQKEKY
jgi:hypothetical protein